MPDWFTQNAPKQDWFEANRPAAKPAQPPRETSIIERLAPGWAPTGPLAGDPSMMGGSPFAIPQASRAQWVDDFVAASKRKWTSFDELAKSVSEALRALASGAAPIALPVAAIAAPVPTAAAVAAGSVAAPVAEEVAGGLGAGPGVSALSGDVAGIAAGGWAAKHTPRLGRAAGRMADKAKNAVSGGDVETAESMIRRGMDMAQPVRAVKERARDFAIRKVAEALSKSEQTTPPAPANAQPQAQPAVPVPAPAPPVPTTPAAAPQYATPEQIAAYRAAAARAHAQDIAQIQARMRPQGEPPTAAPAPEPPQAAPPAAEAPKPIGPLRVVETPGRRNLRPDDSKVVWINPKKFIEQWEKDNAFQEQPFAWNEGRLKRLENLETVDAYPRVWGSNGVGVQDGRHRIATAALRGQETFPVVIDAGESLPAHVLAKRPYKKRAPAKAESPVPEALKNNPEALRIAKQMEAELGQPSPTPAQMAEQQAAAKTKAVSTARGAKVEALAKTLHEGGITREMAKLMNKEHWQQAAQAAGVKVPSAQSIDQTLFELGKLERARSKGPQFTGGDAQYSGKVSKARAMRAKAKK